MNSSGLKSISEFEKLYKVNIPLYSEFDYYYNTLLQSKEFSHLPEALDNLKNLETKLTGEGTGISSYKMKMLDKMVDYLSKTESYKKMQEFDLKTLTPWKSMDMRGEYYSKNPEAHTFVSIDISSANYSVLRRVFGNEEELGNSWDELCDKFNIHPAIKNSKSFRQFVFGNLNPKRSQTIQQSFVTNIVDLLNNAGYKNVIYITHDEVILAFDRNIPIGITSIKKVLEPLEIETKLTAFNVVPTDKNSSKVFVKLLVKENGDSYATLYGVPGNEFYYYFKKYILKSQDIEVRDLYFMNDKKLAMWVPDFHPMHPNNMILENDFDNTIIEVE